MLPRVFLLCVPILVALEHAFQVPAFRLRSGCVLEHQQPGGDTRRVAGRFFRDSPPGPLRGAAAPPNPPALFLAAFLTFLLGRVLAEFRAFWEACVLRTLRSGDTKLPMTSGPAPLDWPRPGEATATAAGSLRSRGERSARRDKSNCEVSSYT